MAKQTIIISGCEDSEDGKRTTFRTNKGTMSAFKQDMNGNVLPLVPTLKSHLEKPIEVEVVQSKVTNQAGNPYLNIRKFYGEGKADAVEAEVEVKTNGILYSKTDSDGIPYPRAVIKPFPAPIKIESKTTTMYTSYAKDILVAMINSGFDEKYSDMMSQAIELVKQAKESF